MKPIVNQAVALVAETEAEIADIGKLSGATQEQLQKLAATVDLRDEKGLNQVARLQSLGALLPVRINARRAALAEAELALNSACERFVSGELGPRFRDIQTRADAMVRAQLKPHFPDGAQLEIAVSNSEIIRECEQIGARIRHKWATDDARVHADSLLKAEGDLDAFAASLGK